MPADKANVIYTAYSGHIALLQTELEAKARTEAAAHRPPTGQASFDGNEIALLSEADRCCVGEQRLFDGKLLDPRRSAKEIEARLPELQNLQEPEVVITEVDTELEQVLRKGHSTQVERMEARMRREVDLRHFMQVNGITGPATYPLSKLNHVAWVLVFIFLESIANTVFYKNESGLLGGFVVAIGVSLLNIGTAYLLGVGFRYRNLADPKFKAFGWACLLAFVALTLFFNALFAAFRSEYQMIADTSDIEALRGAFTNAMNQAPRIFTLDAHLSDFMSFILFGIGVMLSGFAFYKGYTSDDKYPGYGEKDRLYREVLDAEREHTERLRDEVNGHLARHRAQAQRWAQEPRELKTMAARKRGEVAIALQGFEHQYKAITKDFQQVIAAYRNTNRSIRQAPAPAYWDSLPMPTHPIDAVEARNLVAEFESLEHRLQELVETTSQYSQTLLKRLSEFGRECLEVKFPGFISGCGRDAQDRLNRSTPGLHLIGGQS